MGLAAAPTMTAIPTIDLFAGAGGLSLAAADVGCDVVLHVDSDPIACETIRANPRHHRGRGLVLQADVADLDGTRLRSIAGLSKKDPLLVIGGPPCQPFSKAAFWSEDGDDAAFRRARARGEDAARPAAHSHRPDTRRFLVEDYMRLVVGAKADGFVFENVASLAAPRNRHMLERLISAANATGYRTTLIRADAVEFGAPQRRNRIFVLGAKTTAPIEPMPTHALRPGKHAGRLPAATAGPVLAQFRGSEHREEEEVVTGRWAEHLRTVPPGGNYKAHTEWGGHPEPTFVTETRYWNFLLKLSPELPSWTIAANPGPWTGPFHWESRRLRTVEMAALQTFPSGYQFSGNRRARVRQIGNAAPPLLAVPMIAATIASIKAGRRAPAVLAA
jgi:DNA (cytosine-5)-methyltransferase 1